MNTESTVRFFTTAITCLLLGSTAQATANAPSAAQVDDTKKETIAAEEKALSPEAAALKQAVAAHNDTASHSETFNRELNELYAQRDWQPLWVAPDGEWLREREAVVKAVSYAHYDGLDPQRYALDEHFADIDDASDIATLMQRDVTITAALLSYVQDLSVGRVAPSDIFPTLFLAPQDRDYSAMLLSVLSETSPDAMAKAFQRLAPNHADYHVLKKALAQYRAVAERQGAWQPIPEAGVIKPGEADERLPAIRERLILLGRLDGQRDALDTLQAEPVDTPPAEQAQQEKDSAEPSSPATTYDDAMVRAVKAFQTQSGATVDGVIGPETIAELNTPVEQRIEQIKLAMERWRWLPESLGEKYVLTNIAGFYTKAVEDALTVVYSPVIVGKVAHETPAFSSKITNVKFYPDWTVPSSIAHRYLLDKIQTKPQVIDTLGYEIYEDGNKLDWQQVDIAALTDAQFPPYRFRQQPGPNNALGLVRFSIDNDYAIYMHDTPNEALFDEDNRTFSSGCIRVEKREALAEFLLDGNNDRIAAQDVRAMFDTEGKALSTQIYQLDESVPVHLVYMTAYVNEHGAVQFAQDVYGRDEKLASALAQ